MGPQGIIGVVGLVMAAPAATPRTIGARQVSNLVQGRQELTLIHVWATWCGPCNQVFDPLNDVAREGAGRGLRVVAIATDDHLSTVERYLKPRRTAWDDFYVRGGRRALQLEIAQLGGRWGGGVPYDLLLDRHGGVVDQWSGGRGSTDLRRRILDRLPTERAGGSIAPTAASIALVLQGPVTVLFAGREGDQVFVDNWNAGVIPLETELVAGSHDFRVEGEGGRAEATVVVDFSNGSATIDLGASPPSATIE